MTDSDLSNLEWRVVETAINLRLINKPNTPATGYFHAYNELERAVDALIEAREEKEKGMADNWEQRMADKQTPKWPSEPPRPARCCFEWRLDVWTGWHEHRICDLTCDHSHHEQEGPPIA